MGGAHNDYNMQLNVNNKILNMAAFATELELVSFFIYNPLLGQKEGMGCSHYTNMVTYLCRNVAQRQVRDDVVSSKPKSIGGMESSSLPCQL